MHHGKSWLVVAVFCAVAACEGTIDGAADAGTAAPDGGPPRTDAGSVGTDSGSSPTPDAGPSGPCASGPLAAPIPGCMPSAMPATSDPVADCVNRINQFRAECQCLPPLRRWTEGEACVAMHAEYDSTRSPHDGFRDRICSPGGNAQNECPGWPSVRATVEGCLQQMWDEGPGTPFSEHGHYINMSSTGYTEVACGFYTTPGGQVWAVQNFR